MDYSLPGFTVRGILQARILEWVAMPSSRDLPDPGIKLSSLASPSLVGRFFTTGTIWASVGVSPGEPLGELGWSQDAADHELEEVNVLSWGLLMI